MHAWVVHQDSTDLAVEEAPEVTVCRAQKEASRLLRALKLAKNVRSTHMPMLLAAYRQTIVCRAQRARHHQPAASQQTSANVFLEPMLHLHRHRFAWTARGVPRDPPGSDAEGSVAEAVSLVHQGPSRHPLLRRPVQLAEAAQLARTESIARKPLAQSVQPVRLGRTKRPGVNRAALHVTAAHLASIGVVADLAPPGPV